jgi:hypothetical protein
MELSGTLAPLPVVTTVTMRLFAPLGTVTPVGVELRYDPRDPFAVGAVFDTDGAQIPWIFARDLLLDGLSVPTGTGDLHLWPSVDEAGDPVVVLQLCAPDGEAVLQAGAAELGAFLTATMDEIPFGAESVHLDLDGLIADILADVGA